MIGRPKEMEDRKTIQVNIEKADYDILKDRAMKQGIPLSALLRAILEEYVR